MKTTGKKLLSSVMSSSSIASQKSVTRRRICQTLILFCFRGEVACAFSGRMGFSILNDGRIAPLNCQQFSKVFIIFRCGYFSKFFGSGYSWVTPAKSTPAAWAVSASTVLSPI